MGRTERPPIGEWAGPMGLVYGHFKSKEDPGVEYFDLFIDMVGKMQPSTLKPDNDFQTTVNFGGNDYFISFGINSKKTFEADDYIPISSSMVPESLQSAIKNKVRPFWIEIRERWSNILFTDGKRNYRAEIILDKKK